MANNLKRQEEEKERKKLEAFKNSKAYKEMNAKEEKAKQQQNQVQQNKVNKGLKR